MTDSSIIQQARDVLAKRRAATTARQGVGLPVTAAPGDAGLIQLIVNPDLLDAIDKMLESADKTPPTTEWGDHGLRVAGQRIAAAIIAGDERMTS